MPASPIELKNPLPDLDLKPTGADEYRTELLMTLHCSSVRNEVFLYSIDLLQFHAGGFRRSAKLTAAVEEENWRRNIREIDPTDAVDGGVCKLILNGCCNVPMIAGRSQLYTLQATPSILLI